MSVLLRLHQLSRDFGGIAAVHQVDIEVASGARHAVIGPNGAGKTTLLNLVAGTLPPTRGIITFADHTITHLPTPARARRGISRTWQHPAVFRNLSVTANLTLACAHHRTGHHGTTPFRVVHRDRRTAARVTQLVDEAGLAQHAAIMAGRLPYGLQRRLELAMALATQPRLLLLDEPSAGLDAEQIAHLTGLLKSLAEDVTVLLVDHNLELIWSVADTVTVLHHGRHLATGDPPQVRADPQVQAAYLTTDLHTPTGRPHRAARPALLRVTDLRAGYHAAAVLHQVNLSISDGEAVAVLGRNGAGKTTLLNTIAGLLPAQAGHIHLAGQPPNPRRPHHLARAGLALVPQGRRLFAPLTVAEHLACAQTTHRRVRPEAPGGPWTVERVLALLPALAERQHHPARYLSGGEQQMLALARALMTQPRLLILDEPSEGLAPAVIAHLTAVLCDLVAQGLTMLIAEQNLTLATALAHRAVILHAGTIALACPTQTLTSPTHRPRLHKLLGVQPLGVQIDTVDPSTPTMDTTQ